MTPNSFTCRSLVFSSMLSRGISWRSGYLGIAMFQTVLFGILLMAFPLWTAIHGRKGLGTEDAHTIHSSPVLFSTFKTKGVPFALSTFLAYCGIESTMGLCGGGIPSFEAKGWMRLQRLPGYRCSIPVSPSDDFSRGS